MLYTAFIYLSNFSLAPALHPSIIVSLQNLNASNRGSEVSQLDIFRIAILFNLHVQIIPQLQLKPFKLSPLGLMWWIILVIIKILEIASFHLLSLLSAVVPPKNVCAINTRFTKGREKKYHSVVWINWGWIDSWLNDLDWIKNWAYLICHFSLMVFSWCSLGQFEFLVE